MSIVSDRLKEAMSLRKLKQVDLVQRTGIGKSSICTYLSGDYLPKQTNLYKLANALSVDPAWLMGENVPMEGYKNSEFLPPPAKNIIPLSEMQRKRVPMLGNIACGEPIFADEEHELHVEVDASLDVDFCLRAQGDSMIGARIHDGDLVFVRRQDMVENGEIAAVLIGDTATLKRVQYDREHNSLTLFSENPLCRPQYYSGEELELIRILGKAILCQFFIC